MNHSKFVELRLRRGLGGLSSPAANTLAHESSFHQEIDLR